MVKFFMQTYNIPTKRDIDKLASRLDHLEQLILKTSESVTLVAEGKGGRVKSPAAMSAQDTVVEVVAGFKDGVGFSEIHDRTGYEEKKLRNILFRLTKLNRVARKERGIYYTP